MEVPEPEAASASGVPRVCRGRVAVGWALLAGVVGAVVGVVATHLLAGRTGHEGSPGLGSGGGGASSSSLSGPRGARLLLLGPGKIMKQGKLQWSADGRMDGVYLGPGFEYSPSSCTLKVKNQGLYFVYAQLSAIHFVRSSSQEKGNATLTLHRQTAHGPAPLLTLPLHLSPPTNRSLSAFGAASPCLLREGDVLYGTLTMSITTAQGRRKSTLWYFGEGTAFGLFPVPGNCDSESAGENSCSHAPPEVERIWEDLGRFLQSSA
ncbi:tumor necrosis factor ligand superfamily member 9 [Paroedura picta]|uniref:tumor necrosis factor ligand superfamily member 9 n=1 Tax=Paroedura picta TaxID=143630 RepID=UPI0040560388